MVVKRKTPDAPLALKPAQGGTSGNDIFQLNLPSMQEKNKLEVTTFESKHSLAFSCNAPITYDHLINYPFVQKLFPKLEMIDALRSGLLELVEQDTQQVVRLPPDAYTPTIGRVIISPQPSPGHCQASLILVVDTTAQIWKDTLQPYKTYNLRLSATGGAAWCYHVSPSDQSDKVEPKKANCARLRVCGSWYDRHSSSDSSSASSFEDDLPVRRDPGIIRFTVYDDPVPPTCSAVFSLASHVCHLSGTPQFKFITEITLDASDAAKGPVTVGLYGRPFKTDEMFTAKEYIRCVDIATGEEVDFHHPHPCLGELTLNPPDFPTDDWFVELWPGSKPWRHEYTLELEDVSLAGGLECLEAGKKYRAELSSDLKSGFTRWMHGRKEDLLRGTTEEKQQRWKAGPRGRPAISIQQLNEPVEFDVVD